MTQKEMIRQHLLSKGMITSMEAIIEYGTVSPAKRISELRETMNIGHTKVYRKNRFKKNIVFYIYYLEEHYECERCSKFSPLTEGDFVCEFCGYRHKMNSAKYVAEEKARLLEQGGSIL